MKNSTIPKTEKDYYLLAEKRGFKWVGGVLPKNTHAITLWECEKEHRWKARYHYVQRGSGCPICARDIQRKTKKDYRLLAKNRGFKWVGAVLPKYNKNKTQWKCEKGHKWDATYNNISKGNGCPFCAGKVKKTEKDYHERAKNRGFKWVGVVLPKNTCAVTLWKCKKNHEWYAPYATLYGCPVCSGLVKKTEKDYHNLAKKRGFKWVDDVLPKNIITKSRWRCEKGHEWETIYNSIQQGSGCPICSGKIRKTKQDYHKLAKSHGFKWVGKELPKCVNMKTVWECTKGHKWKTIYSSIQQGNGCPMCKDMINGALVSKPQIKLNNLLCGSLNYPEGRYRIDVAIMRRSQKIAVEYDCQYWHQGREAYDAERDSFLIFRGWKIIHVKSGNLLPTRKQLNIVINSLVETNDCIYNLYLRDWKT